MSQPPGSQQQSLTHNNFNQFLINPFERLYKPQERQFSVQTFIKTWVESIFYANKKIDLQAKIDIYWKTTQQKSFQNTSCSVIYTIIRDNVEYITQKLRLAIEQSFAVLKNSSKYLCKMSQTSSSWEINWLQFKHQHDPNSYKHIYPPISNMFITFYKYLNDAAREVGTLWKTIYEHISVKDLKCDTLQQSISELILEVFTASSSTFKPKHMLPVISLANKCKFVNVDKEGSIRRMELTKFKDDELAINLAKVNARKLKDKGFNPKQYINQNSPSPADKKSRLKNREARDNRLIAKTKVDTNIIEEIRNQYLNSYKFNESMKEKIVKYRNVFEQLRKEHNLDYQEPIFANCFETEDNSSQEDDLHDFGCDEKDELIEENEQVQVEQIPFYEKCREIEGSAKLSISTGIEQNNDQYDTILKPYQFDNPPDFILQDEFSSIDPFELDEKEEQLTFELPDKYVKADYKISKQLTLLQRSEEIHSHHKNIEKTRKKISKPHDKREHPKCCLQQEKEKLQKYRKQLQKQKEQLLREVQRFMKEKEKDNNLYRFACNQFSNKGSRKHNKNCIKYTQEVKTIDFARYSTAIKHNEVELNSITRELNASRTFEKYHHEESFCDQQSTVEASNGQENWLEEFKTEKKMSKRQQKLRKKIERQMKELTPTGADSPNLPQKQPISQEELQLNQFLDNLNTTKTNRVTWHIEESQLLKWKNKLTTIRSKVIKECTIPDTSQGKQSKKKKKNRQKA